VTNSPGSYLGRIGVFTTGSAQRLAGPGGQPPGSYSFSAADYVTDPLELKFEPIITTAVADSMLQPGDAFVDQIVAGIGPTSPAAKWRTFEDGLFLPITARGSLFGPFADPPVAAAEVPPDAPLAWTETLILTGPGAYTSSGAFLAQRSGYYTWVWSIDSTDQGPFALFITENYSWQDTFGQTAETAATAIRLEATSQVSEAATGIWQPVSDTLTVTHDQSTGEWWTTDGLGPASAHFVGRAYWIAGDTEPAITTDPPSQAEQIGTRELSITAPGSYTTSPVTAPAHSNGYVVWQWELDDASGYFVPWRDRFGLPAETTRVTVPNLATAADATVARTAEASDMATLSGQPAGESTYLTFAVFKAPEGDPLCDSTTLIDDGLDARIEVTGAGDYRSAPVALDEIGVYHWIATLWTAAGEPISAGTCGAASEITSVVLFIVSTEAVDRIVMGGMARDVATIEGQTPPGATISFESFRQDLGASRPMCERENRVFSQADLMPVGGAGTYRSAAAALTEPGTYLWVETVRTRAGAILHQGLCGARYEVTEVQVPTLAMTGAGSRLVWVALAAIACGVLVFSLRRLQRSVTCRRSR
jgi:hypothetical protein